MLSLVRRTVDELTLPPEEIRARELRRWADDVPDTTRIACVAPRERPRVAGVVTSLRIDPRAHHHAFDAVITDGTGEIGLRWLGRHSLAGISLGRALVAQGVVGRDEDGSLVVLDPEYELVDGPHA